MINEPDYSSYDFSIENIDFPNSFEMKQVQVKKKSMKRIEKCDVIFFIKFRSAEARGSVKSIIIKVKHASKEHKDVIIGHDQSDYQEASVRVKLNLNSVYEVDNFKVYELDKGLHGDKKNIFYLEVEVIFYNNKIQKKETHTFQLVDRKRPQDGVKSDSKRPRLSPADSHYSDNVFPDVYHSLLKYEDESFEKGFIVNKNGIFSIWKTLQNFSQTFVIGLISRLKYSNAKISTYKENDQVLKCNKLVADYIQAKALQLGNLFLGQSIQTTNGDIAYHWPLENEDEIFKEGEVVGLIADINGNFKLRKLTLKNCSSADLKGVISRSYYLQAQTPTDTRRSETICMLGIVPVQVKGSVQINEELYASPEFPGFAVSRYHLSIDLHQSSGHIGYAFSSHNATDDNEEGIVQAAVSVLESASRRLLDAQLPTLESQIDHVAIKQKLTKRYICVCFIACIALAILSSVLLYQIFAPGTSFQYFLCKQGRLRGSASFQYIPPINTRVYPQVRGIEFEFSVLMQKISNTGYKRLNITGTRYYMNIDCCAHRPFIQRSNIPLTHPVTYGPELFAVDKECYNVFYYQKDNWLRYDSISWKNKKNIFCEP
ncbi:uncharacterized protein LOC105845005 isoform X2 [Hydra vulgaris]|nr:uncharacterized protein LOC105845005 [Hydra vulgaris]